MGDIVRYFPDLTLLQRERFAALPELYRQWNERINVVSRRDIDELMTRHVLHSLSIAKVLDGLDARLSRKILDIGTGGGFPAIPLAIMFPEAHVTAVDSIGKKIRVVEQVSEVLGLDNLTAVNARAENVEGRFDWVVSRAVAPAKTLIEWTLPKTRKGWLLLKGGDLTAELAETGRKYELFDIQFDEPFFETKKVVYFKK